MNRKLIVFGPERTLVRGAANDRCEPKRTNAASYLNCRDAPKADIGSKTDGRKWSMN